ncbi:MAG: hypothetical protein AAGD96_05650 [Chloroflexota bacterium]
MEPLYQFLIGIFRLIVVRFVGNTVDNLINFFILRSKLRDLDSKVWALESGAGKVTLNQRDNWLEIILSDHNMGMGILRRPKNVIIEKHEQYKAYIFDHPRRFQLESRV